MFFNSIPYLIFFSIVYLIYWNIPQRLRLTFLLFAGLFFYGWFSIPFLIHFLTAVSINYILYRKIATTQEKKYMVAAIAFNLVNLGFFKYFYFLMKFFGDISGLAFFQDGIKDIKVALPLAISFYSFQMIAASVDAYRNKPEKPIPIFQYYLFVIFFPVLIAGPIMRTGDFFQNLNTLHPDRNKTYTACYLMMAGLFKKILIADPIAGRIAPVFANPDEYTAFSILLSGLMYSLQVYCDFSGLTDMARSSAMFLGFKIPENFFAPFFSVSGKELWRRWHATLSIWLRDYLYFGLGGNRKGEFRTYLNLIITMTLGGLWHGADYTFIIWGTYWGLILCIERWGEEKMGFRWTPEKNRLLILLKASFIFLLFSISALMFRANSLTHLIAEFQGMIHNDAGLLIRMITSAGGLWLVQGMNLVDGGGSFVLNTIKNSESFIYWLILVAGFHTIQYKPEKLQRFAKYNPYLVVLCGILTVFLITTMSQDGDNFIYYRF